jgi:hypothetical protein
VAYLGPAQEYLAPKSSSPSGGNPHAHRQRGQNGPAAAAAEKALLLNTVVAVQFLAAQIPVETGAIDKAQTLAATLSTSTGLSDDSRVYGKRPAPHTSHRVYAARVFRPAIHTAPAATSLQS